MSILPPLIFTIKHHYTANVYATFSILFVSTLLNCFVCISHLIFVAITYTSPKPSMNIESWWVKSAFITISDILFNYE